MGVFGFDALDQFALIRMPGNNRVGMPGPLFHGRFGEIEAQASLAHLRIGPVATEASRGQDGLHILIEIKMLAGCNARLRTMAT